MIHRFNNILIIVLLFSFSSLFAQERKENDSLIGKQFPKMEIKSLSGKIVLYPETQKGKITLIAIAFERKTQDKLDTWLEPFTKKYKDTADVVFYEIPMLKKRWKLLSRYIDGGMRSGISEEKHDYVSTFYGDIDKYRKILNMEDKSDAFLFLLDNNGIIVWNDSGYSSGEKLESLYDIISQLTDKNTR